ncbi:MAG: SDR family oxidoreductase [Vicinamibacterales bacterium]
MSRHRWGRHPVVVVTGASAGVGRATARAFAARGAHLGLLARGPERLDAAAEEAAALGGRAIAIPADVGSAVQVEDAARRVEAEFGPIDVWVNNAMVSVFSPVHQMTAEEYRRVTEVTYLGVVHGTLSALARMRPRDRGAIVQVGSALAYRGIPLQSAYCAAKHAIQGFCDSLRAELLHDGSGVTVGMVQLSAMNTPQFEWVRSRLPHRAQPVPPIYQPEVAAEAIVFAARTGRREVRVGLPAVEAIAGNKVAPGLADRYLAHQGYASQQTDEPEPPGRPDNLWAPVDGDWAAHGRFDDRARAWSPQLWFTRHRGALLGGAAATAALGWMARRAARP